MTVLAVVSAPEDTPVTLVRSRNWTQMLRRPRQCHAIWCALVPELHPKIVTKHVNGWTIDKSSRTTFEAAPRPSGLLSALNV